MTHEPKPEMPTKEGFFWGKWKICDDGTDDEKEFTGSDEWEVMHVYENSIEEDDPEHLMVFVPGVAQPQNLENFFWGKEVTRASSPDSELLEALKVAEELLSEHQTYSDDDGEEYNNNRIIEAVSKIRKTIAKHTGKTG